MADIFDEGQEKFKFNSTASNDFQELDLETFWANYFILYLVYLTLALSLQTMFGSTCVCEATSSALVAIKTKHRNRLKIEEGLCCALYGIKLA